MTMMRDYYAESLAPCKKNKQKRSSCFVSIQFCLVYKNCLYIPRTIAKICYRFPLGHELRYTIVQSRQFVEHGPYNSHKNGARPIKLCTTRTERRRVKNLDVSMVHIRLMMCA